MERGGEGNVRGGGGVRDMEKGRREAGGTREREGEE